MESHPVPQNVTSFEFHLIGDMTIKQFAYLGSGLVIAYLLFIFLFPVSQLISIPLILLSAGFGVAFAFLPIADRPLDHWTVAFFKAVYSPTKRLYQLGKEPVDVKSLQFQNRLNLYLGNSGQPLVPTPIAPTSSPKAPSPKGLEITRILSAAQQNSHPVSTNPPPPAPIQTGFNQGAVVMVKDVFEQNQQLRAQLAQLQRMQPVASHVIASEAKQSIQNTEIATLPAAPRNDALSLNPRPQILSPVNYANTQIKIPPLSVAGPNIIAGTITAETGAPVDGAIIIITNQNNIPVRAVKTNRVGQFNGATPLPDGEYTLTCDKDGFSCDPVKVTLKGELLQPLTIQAKGQA